MPSSIAEEPAVTLVLARPAAGGRRAGVDRSAAAIEVARVSQFEATEIKCCEAAGQHDADILKFV